MVFQSFNLIASMTLAENVELPMRFAEIERGRRDSLAREALMRVGLQSRMNHRPSELSAGNSNGLHWRERSSIGLTPAGRRTTGNLDSRTAPKS